MRRWRSGGPEETHRVGEELARDLVPDGALLLYADLGMGKTVLAQGIASALGIDPRQVLSPTFTVVREHRGEGGRLVHADLYRLRPEDVEGAGLEEVLNGPGVKVVEWAERRGVPVTSPLGRSGSGILCIRPPNAERAWQVLNDAGVVTSLREGAIRLSPHLYNTVEELERVAGLLDRAL